MPAAAADWGDVPGWMTAVGSLAALMFAAVAAIAAVRVYRIESGRDQVRARERREQELAARRGQAALVSAWWGEGDTGRNGTGSRRWGAFIRNASSVPVYQVHITAMERRDTSPPTKFSLPVLPPTEAATFHPVGPPVSILAGPAYARTDPGLAWRDRRVRLTFTDAAGIRWMRDEYGQLTQLRPELTVWTHDRFEQAFSPLMDDVQRTYGVTARVHGHRFAAYQSLVLHGDGTALPEVMVAPHDWCGALARGGTIVPLVLADDDRDQFQELAIAALTFEGRLYAVPYALDTVVLLRNLDLAPEPPATFDDLLATGLALRDQGRVAEVLALQVSRRGDPYHLSPLFTSAGGHLFGLGDDGRADERRVEVASPEAIAAFERIRSLGEAGAGVLRRDIDEERALSLFTSGECAYLVSSYWATERARRADMRLAVGPVPGFRDGDRPRPFVTVNGVFVTRHSPANMIAQDLVPDYLTRAYVIEALAHGLDAPLPIRAPGEPDPVRRTIRDECLNGVLMPSSPEMSSVWRLVGAAQAEIIAGATAAPVARRLAQQLADVSASPPPRSDATPGSRRR